ncbi:hypothetical protein BTN49_3253 [Candidatus Enterovibrio escicola]|uniref:Uncharacterized protein n=1 Tax=Candidatus Enterovibrio escicola TaxID=1927127 RepID=A0A2A5SYY2_9GAMM|nr:hypothetical protein BTN49_3253 [Candidatus Enterovibrio escacola]
MIQWGLSFEYKSSARCGNSKMPAFPLCLWSATPLLWDI